MKKKLISFLLLVAACAPTNPYISPKEGDEKTAYIEGLRENNFFGTFRAIRIKAIDGKILSEGLFSDNKDAVVYEGTHKITVSADFKEGISYLACFSYIDVNARFLSGRKYKIIANLDGATASSWIVDAVTNERVSNVGTGNCSPAQVNTVPIFIPSKR